MSACAVCTKHLASKSRKFCSHKCYWASMSTLGTKKCAKCSEQFKPTAKSNKYCSQSCYQNTPRSRYETQCRRCGVTFATSHKSTKYCSQKCYGLSKTGTKPWNAGRKTGIAPWLGKKRSSDTVERIRLTKALRGCSHTEETKLKISKTTRGRSKGGVTYVAGLIRGIAKYKEWRTSIFRRDAYACVSCGARGVRLNADHIERFSDQIKRLKITSIEAATDCEAQWDLSNGRTLCFPCHRETATFGGRRKKSDLAMVST